MRNEKLDIFRGLAMMWVIFVHCLYHLGYFSWYKSFFLIEMPLFFFISGASNIISRRKSLKEFYLTRLQRILIPYWIYAIFCITLIIIFSPSETVENFINLVYEWINPFGKHPASKLGLLGCALWFIPVYLLAMFIFPIFKNLRLNAIWPIRYMPLIILLLFVGILNFFEEGGRILYYGKMLAFYGFFTYLGMFFVEITAKRRILPALTIITVCGFVVFVLAGYFGQSLNMQSNKFPPNFIFLAYTLGALSIMYLFSDLIVKIITFIKQNVIFKWIFEQYTKYGLTIYLFHTIVLMLLREFKKLYLMEINQYISFFIILFFAILLSAVVGKIFSPVEKIKIFKDNKNVIQCNDLSRKCV